MNLPPIVKFDSRLLSGIFSLKIKPQDVSPLSIVLTMVIFFVVVVVSFQESQEKYRCNQPGLTEL